VEVTTLDQRLVTRKNRKVRLLRERLPGIDVRIIYQRDYLQLLVKYGLEVPEQMEASAVGRRVAAGERPGLLHTAPARDLPVARRRPTSAA
jgi:hypothetical protein